MDKSLKEYHYRFAADLLDVPVHYVVAVTRVEAPGGGFLRDGRPKILYEPHLFSRFTDGVYDKSHPDLSHPVPLYRRGKYGSFAEQWKKLEKAFTLDVPAAIRSCSWGAFQVLGDHWKMLRYSSPHHMMEAMRNSGEQLLAFVRYCQATGADDSMRSGDWESFFKLYNGSDWKTTGYDKKIKAELEKARKEYESVL